MTLHGRVAVPGSKSITHRALILAARSQRECTVEGALVSQDTEATLQGVQALGAQVAGSQFKPSTLTGGASIDCQNSGTTLRLLAGQAATLRGTTKFDGDASLRARPNGPLLTRLAAAGATVSGQDKAPFSIAGIVRGIHHQMPAMISSQFISSLLLAAPFVEGETRVELAEPVASRPYLDVTQQVAHEFGIVIEQAENTFVVPGGQSTTATKFQVEPDWSTGAFPLAAGALAGDVTVEGLNPNSKQGDRAIMDILASFGAQISADNRGVRAKNSQLQSPGEINVMATPDLFPILTVVAACAAGETTFTGGASLRDKESNRIAAMAAALRQMGVEAAETPDGLRVTGGRLRGATVDSRGDHRIYMACAIAGLMADGPMDISHPGCEAVSYPQFQNHLAMLEAA